MVHILVETWKKASRAPVVMFSVLLSMWCYYLYMISKSQKDENALQANKQTSLLINFPIGFNHPVILVVGVVLGVALCVWCLLAGLFWRRRYIFIPCSSHNIGWAVLSFETSTFKLLNTSFSIQTCSRKKGAHVKKCYLDTGRPWIRSLILYAWGARLAFLWLYFLVKCFCLLSLPGCQGVHGKTLPYTESELVSYPLARNIHDSLPNPPLNGEMH